MGDIWRHCGYGSRAPDPGAFIRCVDGRDPMIHEFCCHGIYGICLEVHPTGHIEIPAEYIGGFVTEYLSANGRRKSIFGEFFYQRHRSIHRTF